MKAIVLSHDRTRPMVELMLLTFERLWPYHPFTFRVPFQNNSDFLKCPERVEAVQTSAPIKPCVLELIADLPDEEWVYWCIDDKFLIELNADVASHLVNYVSKINDPAVAGLLFCRCRKMCGGPKFTSERPVAITDQGVRLLRRYDFNQIWLHQLIRVRVLRELFSSFPDRHFTAIEMDDFTQQGENAKKLPEDLIFYVTQQNFMVLGESTRGGKLTRTCVESLNRYGMGLPKGFEVIDDEVRMGGCRGLKTQFSICHEFL